MSGWGTVRAESMDGESSGCLTTPFGPQKFKECANFMEEGGRVHCNKGEPPPADTGCADFLNRTSAGGAGDPGFDIAQIGANTSCYLPGRFNRHGWCYTMDSKVSALFRDSNLWWCSCI